MKKRILFLNQTLELGGIERSLIDVLNHIDYSKYQVDLWLEISDGPFISQVPPQVHIVKPSMNDCYGPYLKVFLNLIKKGQFQVALLRSVQFLSQYLGSSVFSIAKSVFFKLGRYETVISYTDYSFIPFFAIKAFRHNESVLWWHGSGIPPKESIEKYAIMFDHIIPVSLRTANGIRNQNLGGAEITHIANMGKRPKVTSCQNP